MERDAELGASLSEEKRLSTSTACSFLILIFPLTFSVTVPCARSEAMIVLYTVRFTRSGVRNGSRAISYLNSFLVPLLVVRRICSGTMRGFSPTMP